MANIIMPKQRFVIPLNQLFILAVRSVYDRGSLSSEEIGDMERSVVNWTKKIDLTDNEQYVLELSLIHI